MPKIFIDERAFEVAEGLTVLQAAQSVGLEIPHFCYHPAFAPEGSCRMCLVEIEGLPKLELACSAPVKEGLKVRTMSPNVVEARKGVLEFLLADHPLDCPICDKAGECKLQDYFEEYGLYRSQFKEAKEKREKKFKLGQNLILDRERCVLCNRCVRFLNLITKTEEAGLLNRGVRAEVGIFESELVNNNYSGNLVDICPVGAITNSDFRFKTRVWLLQSTESICPLCSRGCNIYIDSHPGFPRTVRTRRVYRVRARENPDVNFHWICDYGRYGYAYLDQGREDRLVWKKSNRETNLSWDKASQILTEKLRSLLELRKNSRLGVVLHTNLTNEELFLADRIFRKGMGVEKLFLADPPEEKGDDFLLTAHRTANRRGLQAVGVPVQAPDRKALSEVDLLLIFGHYWDSGTGAADLKDTLDRVETKVLFASHKSRLDSLVDFVIPVPVLAEKAGTLTNVDGRVQAFAAGLAFEGDGVPEWRVLLELARELKVEPIYSSPMTSPETIYRALQEEIAFFK